MAKPDATEEEMNAVLESQSAWIFLQTRWLADKTFWRKQGNLSGGQCQHFVICKGHCSKMRKSIFLMKQPSNIDVKVKKNRSWQVIPCELAKTRTVLLISHRLANVVKSDQIYFLKDGEIKERGTHAELMEENGAYRHLYESQMTLEHYGERESGTQGAIDAE